MPFLENLILGKPGSDRRRRYAEDSSLTGHGGSGPGLEDFGASWLPNSRRDAGIAPLQEGVSPGERRLCGSLACSSVWTAPWKSRERPVFEGRWACSSRCLSAMVRAALAREGGEDAVDEDGPEPHHHRIPLGLVMLAQGWITHPQLQKALEAQRTHGNGRIGEWLVSECGIKSERIARGLGVQWNCPVLSTESFWPEAMALALPRVFLEEYGVMPLRLAGRKILYIGFQDCLDASASFALEQMTGLRTESGVLPETEFSKARETLLRCEFPQVTMSAVSDRDGLARALAETVEQERPEASKLVRLHRYHWLRVWAKRESSRRGGDMPEALDSVRDYLFTIGSRLPRYFQDNRSLRLASEPARDEAFDDPIVDEIEATTAYRASEPTESAGAAGAHSVLTATQNDENEEAGGWAAPEAEEAEVEASLYASAAPETWPRERCRVVERASTLKEVASTGIVLSGELEQLVESLRTERYLQRRPADEIETIDGEYLTTGENPNVDLAIVSLSAPTSVTRPTRLNRLGQLLRLKPSPGSQDSDPASGLDRGV